VNKAGAAHISTGIQGEEKKQDMNHIKKGEIS